MPISTIFYAVFYDIKKPKTIAYAMHKRIDETLFKNLTDGMGIKEVELKDHHGNISRYRVPAISTFLIQNTVDRNLFVICDCEKI